MIKKLFGIGLCLIFTTTVVFAETTSDEMLNRLKNYRSSIYESLDLSQNQVEKIEEIDSKLYNKLEPELVKVSHVIKNIEDIAKSDNCTIEAIDAQKEDYKAIQKNMSSLSKEYNKEFKKVLSTRQKISYCNVRAKKRAELRKEINAEVKRLRENS